MKALDAVVLRLAQVSFFVGALAIVAMMLHISIDVISRKIFGQALPATLEMTAQWYMVLIVFTPLALLQLRDEHIRVDLFTHRLSPRTQSLLTGIMYAGAVVLLYFWVVSAYDLAARQTRRSAYFEAGLLRLPIWPVYWIVFVSIVLLMAASIMGSLRHLLNAARSNGDH